jgi:hypothetical protein
MKRPCLSYGILGIAALTFVVCCATRADAEKPKSLLWSMGFS